MQAILFEIITIKKVIENLKEVNKAKLTKLFSQYICCGRDLAILSFYLFILFFWLFDFMS